MKKTLCLILAIILASAGLCSCGLIVINSPSVETDSSPVTDTPVTEPTGTETEYRKIVKDTSLRASEYLATIENANYEKSVVKIASAYPDLSDAENAPQVISYAVAERNALVNDKLGVELFTQKADAATIADTVKANAKSGMYYADLLMIPQRSVASLAASGVLFNLRSLPKLDLSAPYFNASSVAAGAAGYDSYAVAGEATYAPHTMWGTFFAKDRLASVTDVSPYELVKAGKWTFDAYYSLVAEAGEYATLSTGKWGDEAVDACWFAAGKTLMSAGVRKYPLIAINSATADADLSLFMPMFTDSRALCRDRGGTGAFVSSALFMTDRLDAMYSLASCGIGWGLLPMPKASEDQEKYITLASGDSLMIAVPSVLLSDVRTSQVLRAICAASAGRIPQAFVDHAQTTLLCDNESAIMLDTILANVRYDFAYTVGDDYPATFSATAFALRNAVFDGESAEATIEYYRYACESALAAAFPND